MKAHLRELLPFMHVHFIWHQVHQSFSHWLQVLTIYILLFYVTNTTFSVLLFYINWPPLFLYRWCCDNPTMHPPNNLAFFFSFLITPNEFPIWFVTTNHCFAYRHRTLQLTPLLATDYYCSWHYIFYFNFSDWLNLFNPNIEIIPVCY